MVQQQIPKDKWATGLFGCFSDIGTWLVRRDDNLRCSLQNAALRDVSSKRSIGRQPCAGFSCTLERHAFSATTIASR